MTNIFSIEKYNKSEEERCPFPTGILSVNLQILQKNIEAIRNHVQKRSNNTAIKYLLPVKSNAYGHGIRAVASFIESQKLCDYLGVAHLQEAYVLREHGIALPILVLDPITYSKQEIEYIVEHDIEIEISDILLLQKLQYVAEKMHKTARIHLSVDTGMGRSGALPKDIPDLLEQITRCQNISLQGVMTHFSVADEEAEQDCTFTTSQINEFKKIKELVLKKFSHTILFHALNSAGTILYIEGLCDMVRPGIASYGYPGVSNELQLEPVMELTSQIALVKMFPQDHPIGYGRTYVTAQGGERIGIIPIGYGDGLFRALSNKAEMIVGGKRQPLRGRISMDQCSVSISSDDKIGDEVVLLGRRGTVSEYADDLAEVAGTISYEVQCALGNAHRLRHVYHY
ncbi:alanine racemase [Candidatus Woesebacteria bacterium]|nr:alanine racemase [Candidatus Woesebacteria bacterium]